MDNLTYRTSGPWGAGLGANLSATQIDTNFYTLFAEVLALSDHAEGAAGIASMAILNGDQLFVTLTNDAVLGPFIIPTSNWNWRGTWAPETVYQPFDTFNYNGS